MKKSFDRGSVRNIDWCLKSVGINVRQTKISINKFYQFVAISPTITALILISLYIIKNLKQANDAVIAAAYVQGTVTMLASIYIFTRNRHKIYEILTLMDGKFYKYPDEKQILVEFPEFLREENSLKISVLIVGYEFFGFSLALVSPIFAYLLTGVYETTSIYPAWYPWGENGTLIQITNTCIQFSGCVTGFWIFYIDQILIASITIELMRQYRRLGAALSNIQSRTGTAVMKSMRCNSVNFVGYSCSFESKYSDVFRENIRHCIMHYQRLWKLFDLFEPWFSIFYSIELSLAMATLALVFYNLLTAWNPSMLLSVIGSALNVLGNLFSRCIIGEIFAEMNTGIKNTIFYEINWWELSTDNRNLLILLHQMSTRIYTLKACSIYTASYYTFSQLLRVSYSFVNIIRTSLIKK
ncbi:uncharacterized protein LOC135840589 [Planococcus citri]|uniref:uncharacterized protein LOC135840589 n=1 Tax=Planococcus citri TaxID=170843 RepID=UPI0031F912BC